MVVARGLYLARNLFTFFTQIFRIYLFILSSPTLKETEELKEFWEVPEIITLASLQWWMGGEKSFDTLMVTPPILQCTSYVLEVNFRLQAFHWVVFFPVILSNLHRFPFPNRIWSSTIISTSSTNVTISLGFATEPSVCLPSNWFDKTPLFVQLAIRQSAPQKKN